MPITAASLRTAQRRFAPTVIDTARIGLGHRSRSLKPWKIVITTVIALLLAFAALAYAMIAPEGLSARKKPSNFEFAIANSQEAQQLRIRNCEFCTRPVDSVTPENTQESFEHYTRGSRRGKEALHGPLRPVPRKRRQRQDRNERRYVARGA